MQAEHGIGLLSSLAAHLLADGYDIRMTKCCTRVLNRRGRGVRSPEDGVTGPYLTDKLGAETTRSGVLGCKPATYTVNRLVSLKRVRRKETIGQHRTLIEDAGRTAQCHCIALR